MNEPTSDKAAQPTGPGFVCLDSMVLIHFNRAGCLDVLGSWFGPRAFTAQVVTEVELRDSAGRHPENAAILSAEWLEPVAVDDIEDIRLVAELRRRWGSSGNKDRGEADIIALCRRHGWTAITDDEVGRKAAGECGVSRVYMLTAIIAAASSGLIAPTEAWNLHCSIERRRRMAVLSPDDAHKPVFMACINQLKKVDERQGNPEWPMILAVHGLDDVVVRTRRNM